MDEPARGGEHEAYLRGVELYNAGLFWEAHEAWEARWRVSRHDPRLYAYLQGLIQCAAACLKAAQGDAGAATRISARAMGRLERVANESGGVYMGLDLVAYCRQFRAFVAARPLDAARRPRIVLRA